LRKEKIEEGSCIPKEEVARLLKLPPKRNSFLKKGTGREGDIRKMQKGKKVPSLNRRKDVRNDNAKVPPLLQKKRRSR